MYNYNGDNVREVAGDPHSAPGAVFTRVDSLGHYVFRFSDDGGRSWSSDRYDIPVREFDIDREKIAEIPTNLVLENLSDFAQKTPDLIVELIELTIICSGYTTCFTSNTICYVSGSGWNIIPDFRADRR